MCIYIYIIIYICYRKDTYVVSICPIPRHSSFIYCRLLQVDQNKVASQGPRTISFAIPQVILGPSRFVQFAPESGISPQAVSMSRCFSCASFKFSRQLRPSVFGDKSIISISCMKNCTLYSQFVGTCLTLTWKAKEPLVIYCTYEQYASIPSEAANFLYTNKAQRPDMAESRPISWSLKAGLAKAKWLCILSDLSRFWGSSQTATAIFKRTMSSCDYIHGPLFKLLCCSHLINHHVWSETHVIFAYLPDHQTTVQE